MSKSKVESDVRDAMRAAASNAAYPVLMEETERLEAIIGMVRSTTQIGVHIEVPAPFLQAVQTLAALVSVPAHRPSVSRRPNADNPLGEHTLASTPAAVLSLPQAVREVLRERPGSPLTTNEVYKVLIEQGWVSNSSDPKNVVNNALSKAMAEWPDEILRPARGCYMWEPRQPELPSAATDGGDAPPDADVAHNPNYDPLGVYD